MAQKTTDELITKYETIIDNIETKLEAQEGYAEIEGQGSEGARTKFTNPEILEKRAQKYRNKVANLRLRSDATV